MVISVLLNTARNLAAAEPCPYAEHCRFGKSRCWYSHTTSPATWTHQPYSVQQLHKSSCAELITYEVQQELQNDFNSQEGVHQEQVQQAENLESFGTEAAGSKTEGNESTSNNQSSVLPSPSARSQGRSLRTSSRSNQIKGCVPTAPVRQNTEPIYDKGYFSTLNPDEYLEHEEPWSTVSSRRRPLRKMILDTEKQENEAEQSFNASNAGRCFLCQRIRSNGMKPKTLIYRNAANGAEKRTNNHTKQHKRTATPPTITHYQNNRRKSTLPKLENFYQRQWMLKKTSRTIRR